MREIKANNAKHRADFGIVEDFGAVEQLLEDFLLDKRYADWHNKRNREETDGKLITTRRGRRRDKKHGYSSSFVFVEG